MLGISVVNFRGLSEGGESTGRNGRWGWWLSFAAGIDEAGQAVNVAPEAGPIGQQTVKPSQMGVDQLDDIPDVEHCEEGAGANNCPWP